MSLATRARTLARGLAEARAVELPDDVRELTGYRPRPLQAELEAAERRFNVEVMHRRFGKTVFKVNKLIERAVDCPYPDGRYAYLAPTYAMAEDIAWTYLLAFTEGIPRREVQASRLAVWLPTRLGSRARIRLYGVDSPKERLRGLYLDGVVFDEYAHIPPAVMAAQVRPMLADENRAGVDRLGRVNQWADYIFTPFGRNHAYTLYRKARAWHEGQAVTEMDLGGVEHLVRRDDYFAALMRGSETGILSEAERVAMLNDMGRAKYQQEVECDFDAAVEGAIYARDLEEIRARGQVGRVAYNKLLPVSTAWDLGWDDATAIWFAQRVGSGLHVVDYYEATGADLTHYADVLAQRGYRYDRHYLPPDVAQHEMGVGKSREQILRSLGVRVTVVPKHRVHDGIAAVQALLPRCYFDEERCAEGLDRLALYRREYDERLQRHREKPLHDWASHGADAFRMLAMGLRAFRGFGEEDWVQRPSVIF